MVQPKSTYTHLVTIMPRPHFMTLALPSLTFVWTAVRVSARAPMAIGAPSRRLVHRDAQQAQQKPSLGPQTTTTTPKGFTTTATTSPTIALMVLSARSRARTTRGVQPHVPLSVRIPSCRFPIRAATIGAEARLTATATL